MNRIFSDALTVDDHCQYSAQNEIPSNRAVPVCLQRTKQFVGGHNPIQHILEPYHDLLMSQMMP